MDFARHDAQLAFARRDNAWTVRADEHGSGRTCLHQPLDLDHILNGNSLGNTDTEIKVGVHRFHHSVSSISGWNIDDGGIRPGFADRFLDGVKHRGSVNLSTASSGDNPGDDVGAVFFHFLGVEFSLRAGKPLHENFRPIINKYAHCLLPLTQTLQKFSFFQPCRRKPVPRLFALHQPWYLR